VLGKGGVIAKDTPNFIGNRLGSFAGMQAVTYAFENGYSIEEVDAITGPLIGHPKTATFRLNDTVGLDIAVGVAENLYEAVPEDESREDLKPHPKLKEMQERNLLGNKTGAGFYKRDKREGKTVFDVLDLETFEHRPAEDPDVPSSPRRRSRATSGRGCASSSRRRKRTVTRGTSGTPSTPTWPTPRGGCPRSATPWRTPTTRWSGASPTRRAPSAPGTSWGQGDRREDGVLGIEVGPG
jgi:3-hydroxyacyl-CoA dehydrogenase